MAACARRSAWARYLGCLLIALKGSRRHEQTESAATKPPVQVLQPVTMSKLSTPRLMASTRRSTREPAKGSNQKIMLHDLLWKDVCPEGRTEAPCLSLPSAR